MTLSNESIENYNLDKNGYNFKIFAYVLDVVSNEEKLSGIYDESDKVFTIDNPASKTTCTSTSTPSIKILSPKGDEVFSSGEKINVKWKSCNTDKDNVIYINLGQKQINFGDGKGYNFGNQLETKDTGSAKYTLPDTSIKQ